jgi:formylmethanofuran dehydrogenase subunit E
MQQALDNAAKVEFESIICELCKVKIGHRPSTKANGYTFCMPCFGKIRWLWRLADITEGSKFQLEVED